MSDVISNTIIRKLDTRTNRAFIRLNNDNDRIVDRFSGRTSPPFNLDEHRRIYRDNNVYDSPSSVVGDDESIEFISQSTNIRLTSSQMSDDGGDKVDITTSGGGDDAAKPPDTTIKNATTTDATTTSTPTTTTTTTTTTSNEDITSNDAKLAAIIGGDRPKRKKGAAIPRNPITNMPINPEHDDQHGPVQRALRSNQERLARLNKDEPKETKTNDDETITNVDEDDGDDSDKGQWHRRKKPTDHTKGQKPSQSEHGQINDDDTTIDDNTNENTTSSDNMAIDDNDQSTSDGKNEVGSDDTSDQSTQNQQWDSSVPPPSPPLTPPLPSRPTSHSSVKTALSLLTSSNKSHHNRSFGQPPFLTYDEVKERIRPYELTRRIQIINDIVARERVDKTTGAKLERLMRHLATEDKGATEAGQKPTQPTKSTRYYPYPRMTTDEIRKQIASMKPTQRILTMRAWEMRNLVGPTLLKELRADLVKVKPSNMRALEQSVKQPAMDERSKYPTFIAPPPTTVLSHMGRVAPPSELLDQRLQQLLKACDESAAVELLNSWVDDRFIGNHEAKYHLRVYRSVRNSGSVKTGVELLHTYYNLRRNGPVTNDPSHATFESLPLPPKQRQRLERGPYGALHPQYTVPSATTTRHDDVVDTEIREEEQKYDSETGDQLTTPSQTTTTRVSRKRTQDVASSSTDNDVPADDSLPFEFTSPDNRESKRRRHDEVESGTSEQTHDGNNSEWQIDDGRDVNAEAKPMLRAAIRDNLKMLATKKLKDANGDCVYGFDEAVAVFRAKFGTKPTEQSACRNCGLQLSIHPIKPKHWDDKEANQQLSDYIINMASEAYRESEDDDDEVLSPRSGSDSEASEERRLSKAYTHENESEWKPFDNESDDDADIDETIRDAKQMKIDDERRERRKRMKPLVQPKGNIDGRNDENEELDNQGLSRPIVSVTPEHQQYLDMHDQARQKVALHGACDMTYEDLLSTSHLTGEAAELEKCAKCKREFQYHASGQLCTQTCEQVRQMRKHGTFLYANPRCRSCYHQAEDHWSDELRSNARLQIVKITKRNVGLVRAEMQERHRQERNKQATLTTSKTDGRQSMHSVDQSRQQRTYRQSATGASAEGRQGPTTTSTSTVRSYRQRDDNGDEPPDDRSSRNVTRAHEVDQSVYRRLPSRTPTPSVTPSPRVHSSPSDQRRRSVDPSPSRNSYSSQRSDPSPRRSEQPACRVWMEDIPGDATDVNRVCTLTGCGKAAGYHEHKPAEQNSRQSSHKINLRDLNSFPEYGEDGTNSYKDPTAFINKFEQVGTMAKVSLPDLVNILRQKVRSNTDGDWVKNHLTPLANVPGTEWADIKRKFLEHCGGNYSVDVARQMLTNPMLFKQTDNESVSQYRARFESLVLQAEQNLQTDTSLVGRFREGLHSRSLDMLTENMPAMKMQNPNVDKELNTNMEKLVEAVKTYEAALVQREIRKNSHSSSSASSSSSSSSSSTNAERAEKQTKAIAKKATNSVRTSLDMELPADSASDSEERTGKRVKKPRSRSVMETRSTYDKPKKSTRQPCVHCDRTNHESKDCYYNPNKRQKTSVTTTTTRQQYQHTDDNDDDDVSVSSSTRQVNNVLNINDTSRLPSVNRTGQKPPEPTPPTTNTLKRERDTFEGMKADPNMPTSQLARLDQRQRDMTNGNCFYCKQPGHRIANCPKKQSDDQYRRQQRDQNERSYDGRDTYRVKEEPPRLETVSSYEDRQRRGRSPYAQRRYDRSDERDRRNNERWNRRDSRTDGQRYDRIDDSRRQQQDDRQRPTEYKQYTVSAVQQVDRHVKSEKAQHDNASSSDDRSGQQQGLLYCVLMVNGASYKVLCDTGSVVSFVHPNVLRDAQLAITVQPEDNGAEIVFANPEFRQKRLGAVDLLIDVRMSGKGRHHIAPTLMQKRFEVMTINHDFLFGMDMLPFIHPIFREALDAGLVVADVSKTKPPVIYSARQRDIMMNERDYEEYTAQSVTTNENNHLTVCRVTFTEEDEDRLYRYVGENRLLVDKVREQAMNDQDELRTRKILEAYRTIVEDEQNDLQSPLNMKKKQLSEEALTIDGYSYQVEAIEIEQSSDAVDKTADVGPANIEQVASQMQTVVELEKVQDQEPISQDDLTRKMLDVVSDNMYGEDTVDEPLSRPTVSSPFDSKIYDQKRLEIEAAIEELLTLNKAITGFCSHPDSKMTIRLRKDVNNKELFMKQYPVALQLIRPATKILSRWYQDLKIELGKQGSPINCAIRLAPKKDEFNQPRNVRLCLDMRIINAFAEKLVNFVIPRVEDAIRMMGGAMIFSDLDLSEAYSQCELTKESREFTTFRWMNVAYQSRFMPFGFRDAPENFQRLMIIMFADMLHRVFIYFDNLCIYTKTFEEHEKTLVEVLTRLNKYNMKVKPGSLRACHQVINILGRQISGKGIGVDDSKLEVISKWEQPRDVGNLRAFLGFAGFMADHIRHFADLAAPLYAAKSTKGPLEWTTQMTESFKLLKRAAAKAPWLVHADTSKHFVIACDASRVGIGAVLYQVDDKESCVMTCDNIIACYSRKNSKTQAKYSPYKLEVMAMTAAFSRFHTYVYGREFTVITDHKPIIFIKQKSEFPISIQCWTDILLSYNFIPKHRPGIMHVVPDALSRMYNEAYPSDVTWGVADKTRLAEVADKLSPSDVIPKAEFETIQFKSETELKQAKHKQRQTMRTEDQSDTEDMLEEIKEMSIEHDPLVMKAEREAPRVYELPDVEQSPDEVETARATLEPSSNESVREMMARWQQEGAIEVNAPVETDPSSTYLRIDDVTGRVTVDTNQPFKRQPTQTKTTQPTSKPSCRDTVRDFEKCYKPPPPPPPAAAALTTNRCDRIKLAAFNSLFGPCRRQTVTKEQTTVMRCLPVQAVTRSRQNEQKTRVITRDDQDAHIRNRYRQTVNVHEDGEVKDDANARGYNAMFRPLVDKLYDPSVETDDDRLLVALERRGLKKIPVSQRTAMIEKEHALGHFGRDAIYTMITKRRHAWWPGIRRDIEKVIGGCTQCLAYTALKGWWHPALSLHTSYPGQHYQADIMELPPSRRGCKALLVLIDLFTGFVLLFPIMNQKAREIAQALLAMFAIIGPPKILESDNAPQLVGDIIRAFNELVGVNQRPITPWHPQSNGRVERMNQTVRHAVRKLLEGTSVDWEKAIPFIQMTINRKLTRRTGLSPFEMMFGREMAGFEDYTNDKLTRVEDMSPEEWIEYQKKFLAVIYPAVEMRTREEEESYTAELDRKRKFLLSNKLPNGTVVLVKDPLFVKDDTKKPKYASLYLPSKYKVIGSTPNGAYSVVNMDTEEVLDRKVTIDQVRRISGPVEETTLDKDGEEYELEEILGERTVKGRPQMLLKWKGYTKPTWEWTSNVHAPKRRKEYETRKRQKKLKPIGDEDQYEDLTTDEAEDTEGIEAWKTQTRKAVMREYETKQREADKRREQQRRAEAEMRDERARQRDNKRQQR